jgi:hypothetical protein
MADSAGSDASGMEYWDTGLLDYLPARLPDGLFVI